MTDPTNQRVLWQASLVERVSAVENLHVFQS